MNEESRGQNEEATYSPLKNFYLPPSYFRLQKMPPESCPNCGADVPRNAKACPDCGADEKTGWSDSAYASGLGIPDEDFDYENFVKEEFSAEAKPHGISWLWWITALLLILLFLFLFLR